jgi:hypothetical protein
MLRLFSLVNILILTTVFLAVPAAAGEIWDVTVLDDTPTHLLLTATNFRICEEGWCAVTFGPITADHYVENWSGFIATSDLVRVQSLLHEVAPHEEESEIAPMWGPAIMIGYPAVGTTSVFTDMLNHVNVDYQPTSHTDYWRSTVLRTGADTLDISVEAFHGASDAGEWFDFEGGTVPEPATLGLLGGALLALGVMRHRRA